MSRQKINTYFAVLIITLVGLGAVLIIMHVANTKSFGNYTRHNIATSTSSVFHK